MENFDNSYAVIAKHQRRAPVDVNAIARELGLNVYYADLGKDISGQIVRRQAKWGFCDFTIYINSKHHPNRQRFSLAHEIAHYVLHRDLIESGVVDDTMYRSRELNSHYESQANRMAADILMPIMLVKKTKARYAAIDENAINDMAQVFQVSSGAMKIRLSSLKRTDRANSF